MFLQDVVRPKIIKKLMIFPKIIKNKRGRFETHYVHLLCIFRNLSTSTVYRINCKFIVTIHVESSNLFHLICEYMNFALVIRRTVLHGLSVLAICRTMQIN